MRLHIWGGGGGGHTMESRFSSMNVKPVIISKMLLNGFLAQMRKSVVFWKNCRFLRSGSIVPPPPLLRKHCLV